MKKLSISIWLLLIQCCVYSQPTQVKIQLADDLELIKISVNAYIHVSYINTEKWGRVGANGLVLINNKKAFLLDSPWTNAQTEVLYSWITDSMKLELIGFIPNHWHEDCMGGLAYLQKQKVKSYANQLTINLAKENGLPSPDYGFTDSLELKLGDKAIYCYYLGAAHSMDNIVVWITAEQILFPACMVKSMNSNNLGNTADGDLYAYPLTLHKLLEKFPSAKIVIPGHGEYGGVELIRHTLKLAEN